MPWPRSFATLALVITTGVIAVAGCDGESETKPEAKPETKDAGGMSAQACAVRGQAMEQELLAACAISDQVLKVDVPFTPWKSAPSSAPVDALWLELSPKGVVVGWGPPRQLTDFEERLLAERDHASMTPGSRGPLSWVLAIDGSTSRSDVAAVLSVLSDANLHQGWLQLATTSMGTIPKPRDPKQLADLAARMPADDPSQRAPFLAKEIERAMPRCPGARKAFDAVAVAAPEQRCELLARGVAAGLVGCGCPKVDSMMTLLYAISVGTEPPKRLGVAAPTTLEPKAKSRPGATWTDVVESLPEEALSALWLSRR